MLGVLLAAAVAAQPSPAPLRTIVHLRSSPFCTALHQHVAPALRGLILNKFVVTQGKDVFLAMARDTAYGSGARVEFQMQRLNGLITPMVQNLAVTDAELDRLNRQDPELQKIRSRLEAIADEQRKMLNVFSGTYGTYSSTALLDRNNPVGAAIAPETVKQQPAPAEVAAPGAVARAADEPQNAATPVSTPGMQLRTVDMGLAGDTAFAQLYNTLTSYQQHELSSETQAADEILQAAAACR